MTDLRRLKWQVASENWSELTRNQKASIKKTLTELTLIMLLPMLSGALKDAADEADTKLIRDDGGFTPTGEGAKLVPGPNNPNPLKPNGERTFDWYDPNYDLALHTVKRPDGRFEIKMIENQTGKPDELIMQVNKDGTVEIRKCL